MIAFIETRKFLNKNLKKKVDYQTSKLPYVTRSDSTGVPIFFVRCIRTYVFKNFLKCKTYVNPKILFPTEIRFK